MGSSFLFSSESVTEGHPDKVCDQISDAVLDGFLAQDPDSRVACETLAAGNLVVIAGEITSRGTVDYEKIARKVIREIGYTNEEWGIDATTCRIQIAVGKQSPDISQGVTEGEGLFKEQGAGDQGMMFGYATNETPERMPMPILYAHKLTERLAQIRKKGVVNFLRPDGKSQVTVQYVNGRPHHIPTVVLSTQHSPDVAYETLKEAMIEEVIKKVLPSSLLSNKTHFLINPTGRFVTGGPLGDSGLTGRKIIVDTYGGWGRHGGGAFSGKDPSKVDRSACYMARHIAKNIVASELAERCEVQIAYAIGYPEPVSFMVDTFGTGALKDEEITEIALKTWSLKPAAIVETLKLKRPIYQKTASYGHFGRNDTDFTWETTDRVKQLRTLGESYRHEKGNGKSLKNDERLALRDQPELN
ncbi:MAG: methionine adenosyltransferase [Deltaproteobacteria bacterium]|nr:methionine adenosyltransferase [Deltaproteobacteria bacterium]